MSEITATEEGIEESVVVIEPKPKKAKVVTARMISDAISSGELDIQEEWDILDDPDNGGTEVAKAASDRFVTKFGDWFVAQTAPKERKQREKKAPKPARVIQVGDSLTVSSRIARREETLWGNSISHSITFASGESAYKELVVQSEGQAEYTVEQLAETVVKRWTLFLSMKDEPETFQKEFARGRNAMVTAKVLKDHERRFDNLIKVVGEGGWSELQTRFLEEGDSF